MRRFVCAGLAVVLLAMLAGSALAWEFKMKGDAEWRYRYWGRTGVHDLFGTMDADHVNLGVNHLATFPTQKTQDLGGGKNGGVELGTNNFGSDMSMTDYRVTFYPKIQINKAISLDANVNLTSLGIWSDGQPYATAAASPGFGYVNSLYASLETRPAGTDIPNTYVTLQWLKTSIKTPMLNFSIGYKGSHLGMGLWKHKKNRASASFGVSSKYGPFKIGFSPYFSRRNSEWVASKALNYGDKAQQRKEYVRNYFWAFMGEISYASGPFELLFASDSYREEATPKSQTSRASAIGTPSLANADRIRYRFHLSSKYFNGRFFANAEADWFNIWESSRKVASSATLTGEGFNANGWLYGFEFGTLAGPSKITFSYIRATGDDITTRETREDSMHGDAGVSDGYMGDWGYLMYHMYGTGSGFGADGFGFPTDVHHVGGRLDYAVAANLNIFGIYAQAWRDQPSMWQLGGDYYRGVARYSNEKLRTFQLGTTPDTPVPDSARDIGWEVDCGFAWKLLENCTWAATFAYWQPGSWWSHALPNSAYMYRQISTTASLTANRDQAIYGAGRQIDPLFAVETNLLIQF